MILALFTVLPVVVGVVLILAAIWEYMTWKNRFAAWKEGMATSLGAIKKKGDVGPRLAYEYKVDGVRYEGTSTYMRDDLPKKGEGISIYYDPAQPQASDWYDMAMHRFFMFGVGLLGLFLIWIALH